MKCVSVRGGQALLLCFVFGFAHLRPSFAPVPFIFQQTDVLLCLLLLYSRCFEQRRTRGINIFNLCQHSSDTVMLLTVRVCVFLLTRF